MKGLPYIVKEYLNKAKESALLAVEIYNKPSISFKSGGYITLMIIAWTALFHAYFFKKKIKPYYRNGRRFETIKEALPTGKKIYSYKHWDISDCIKQYFRDKTEPSRINIEFFIPLRNMIEHRNMPELDINIYGECQSLISNFNEFIEKEIGGKHSLKGILPFALQFSPLESKLMDLAAKDLKKKGLDKVVRYIKDFRSSLSSDVFENSKYSFKAILIKVANHEGRDTLPIKFIKYEDLGEDERNKLKDMGIVLIKEKQVSVIHGDKYKPSGVVSEVASKIGKPFSTNLHFNCWRKYKIRPLKGDSSPERTNSKYCIYDKIHKDYLYTKEWIDFLSIELVDDAKYKLIENKRISSSSFSK